MRDPTRPAALVRPAEDLKALAGRINARHDAALGCVRESLEHARAAGEMLARAKKAVGHGEWLRWLEASVRFSDRTARAYMRVASDWDKLATAADMTLGGALLLLAGDNDEPPASLAAPPPLSGEEMEEAIDEILAAAPPEEQLEILERAEAKAQKRDEAEKTARGADAADVAADRCRRSSEKLRKQTVKGFAAPAGGVRHLDGYDGWLEGQEGGG